MIELILQTKNGDSVSRHESGITGAQLAEFCKNSERPVIAYKFNNETVPLSTRFELGGRVEPIFLNSKEAVSIYKNSLCAILTVACRNLFPDNRLLINYSFGSVYYYTLEDKILSESDVTSIKKEMNSLIEKDIEFKTERFSYTDAISILKSEGLCDTVKQLQFNCKSSIMLSCLDGYYDLYSGLHLPSTGFAKNFELRFFDAGMELYFPVDLEKNEFQSFDTNQKLFEMVREYKDWGKRVGVSSVSDLNELISKRKINDFIDITETFQSQNYAKVAQQIYDRKNVKVVLIAGPSSSGKTTSAKKLALHLMALCYNPKIISLDDYFVGRANNPRDENGNYDYECLEALDVALLNKNLNDLFDGKEVDLPSYNFDLGERFYTGKKMKLAANDILILEGIHGLNERLTPDIKKEYKFKVYLSAMTQLTLNDHIKISTSDNRLIRRIVRDARYRGKPAAGTIAMWDSVRRGEHLHIFPFQHNADAVLNTALDYEISALKVYVEPLLKCVSPEQPEYWQAARLLRLLSNFHQIPDDYIPTQSIIREFIGGSAFHY